MGTLGPICILFDPAIPGKEYLLAFAALPIFGFFIFQIVMILRILKKLIGRTHKALRGNSRAFKKLEKMPGNNVQAGALLFAICGFAIAISHPLGGTHVAGGQAMLILFVVASPFFLYFGMKVSQLYGYTVQKRLVGCSLCIVALVIIVLLAIPQIGQELLSKSVWNVFLCCAAVIPCVVLYWGIINYLVSFTRKEKNPNQKKEKKKSDDTDGPFSLGSALCCLCVALPFFVVVPILVASDGDPDIKTRLLAGTVFFAFMAITTGLAIILAGSMQSNMHENETKIRVRMIRKKIKAEHQTRIKPEAARSIVDRPILCDEEHEADCLMCDACKQEI